MVSGVITASEPSWIAPFTGLSPRLFGKLVTVLRHEGADAVRKGPAMEPAAGGPGPAGRRVLAPQPDPSSARAAVRGGPALALQQRERFRKGTVLIVDGTLVPTSDHQVAAQSKNHRYFTNHQVVIDADPRLVVAVGRALPGNRNDCKAWELSGAKDAVGRATVIADGGYRGTGLVIPCTVTYPARPNSRPGGLEGKPRPLPPQGPRPRRACLRPDEDLEDPPRLPPQGRRRPSRHARHRPFIQPHSRRVIGKRRWSASMS